MIGRLVTVAHDHATGVLRAGLAEANGWTPARFAGGDRLFLSKCQGVVRLAYHFAVERIAYLDTVPWLLGRLDDPGVAARALAQYDGANVAVHDSVSREILGVGGRFRADVEAIAPDGTGISAALKTEVASIQLTPLDDTVNEGAQGTRISPPEQRGIPHPRWACL